MTEGSKGRRERERNYPTLEERLQRSRAAAARKYEQLPKGLMPWNFLADALRLVQWAQLRTRPDNIAVHANLEAVKELLAQLATDLERAIEMYDQDLIENQREHRKMLGEGSDS